MARTRRGSKSPGRDFWSDYPGNENGNGSVGKFAKMVTHRKERYRAQGKILEELDSVYEELDEFDYNFYEDSDEIEDFFDYLDKIM